MSRCARIRLQRMSAALSVMLLIAAVWNVVAAPFVVAGLPLYPDLKTAPPSNLILQSVQFPDGFSHVLLRFDNIIQNHGGRLEIVADLSKSRDLYQNVYDENIGGNLVETRKIQADLIFHPTHNHFHVTDFSTYRLYKKNAAGDYVPTNKTGTKTSFCITDSIRFAATGPSIPGFRECSASRQGLDSGWSDIYTAGLPEQWVDTGPAGLSDGDYALHSTADPLNRMRETNDGNNTGITHFRILNGEIESAPQTIPYCAAKPTYAPVGTIVNVTCANLDANESFSVRWMYASAPPLGSAITSAAGTLQVSFPMPASTWGVHYLHITSDADDDAVRALIQTAPAFALSRSIARTGNLIDFELTGFTSAQAFRVTVPGPNGAALILATGTSNDDGSASGSFVLPRMTAGNVTLILRGTTGGKAVRSTLTIVPILRIGPSTIEAGGAGRIKLDGFAGGEQVRVKVAATGRTLRTVTAGADGSVAPGPRSSFAVPPTMAPGRHVLTATGLTSGLTASFTITITGAIAADDPTTTPTTTPPPAPTATATSIASPTQTSTPDALITPETTIAADPTLEPTAEPTESATPTSTPAAEPTAELTPEPTAPPAVTPETPEPSPTP